MASSILLSDNGVTSGSAGIKSTGGSDGTLLLQTTTASGTATTAVLIDNAQNVGVGVTPSAWQSSVFTGVFEQSKGTYIAAATSTPDVYFGVNAYYNGGWIYKTSSYASQYRQAAGSHIWNIAASGTANNSISFTQAMTLDSSGNLLVGTTSGSQKLVVKAASGAAVSSFVLQGASGVASDIQYFYASNASTVVGYITYNGTNTQYITTSDARLKENIVEAPSALAKVTSLSVKSFNWKDSKKQTDYGFIAQEVFEIEPNAVSIGKDNQDGEVETPWGVDNSMLVPMLTKALQEQQSLIQSLTDRLTALEGAAK